MIVVSHPTGNEFVRALLSLLERKQLLGRFFTTLNAPGERWLRRLPRSIRAQVARRAFAVPDSKITTRPLRETVRLIANAAGIPPLVRHETGWASLDAVYAGLDRSVASWIKSRRPQIRAVHCYEDGALETFRAAAEQGIGRVYELPIAYWKTTREILEEEARRLPAWGAYAVCQPGFAGKTGAQNAEIDLAEVVVCPSRFVRDSLPEHIRSSENAPWPTSARRRRHRWRPARHPAKSCACFSQAPCRSARGSLMCLKQ